jgi:5-dehydro-4-deoxyglucarate dehydratase
MRFTPVEMAGTIGRGLLSFPVTHFDASNRFDVANYRAHCAWLMEYELAGLFAAGGTGEFPALAPPEVDDVVRAAVEASERPVIAPAGYTTPHAVAMARDAEEAGAAGVFLLPPYLAALDQDDLTEHVGAVCAATALGVVVPAGITVDDCPNLVPFPDGEPFPGVHTRLSAALPTLLGQLVNFAPRVTVGLHTALHEGDAASVHRTLDEFVLPYLELRDRRAGYAVATVKAALTAVGRPAGPVRPPLTDVSPTDQGELNALLDKARVA